MLCLQADTNPGWIDVAASNILAIMQDHAHCEKKAALNAMHLIRRYAERDLLVQEMITVLEEETAHFKLMVGELRQRGLSLARDRGNPYARQLDVLVRPNDPERLMDMLLVDALIEARSCERFTLLARCEAIPADLRGIYHALMSSEEGHYLTFVHIAKEYFPEATVNTRFDELCAAEAAIVRGLQNRPAMHG
jgi:tRNA 2-(methylsulfanyl)-N6-isopentenyladenosine37 hydroxylase